MSWEPKSGRTLALPFGDTVKLFQRGTWDEVLTLKDPAIKKVTLIFYKIYQVDYFTLLETLYTGFECSNQSIYV